MSVLDNIIAHRREDVARAKRALPPSTLSAGLSPSNRGFYTALARPGLSLIAEVKKKSPSRGPIRPDLDLRELLSLYDRHADAVSVLTEERHFGGSLQDLTRASELTSIPLLRKDFIVDPYQVDEARISGADAVLLIVAALDGQLLVELQEQARHHGMDALVEVHDEDELQRALDADADIIGINNRNLHDLSIDLAVTERLAPLVPEGKLVVSESGILGRSDLLRMRPCADAILVGSAILAADDMDARVKELAYGRVKVCGITSRQDAVAALDAGATWLGFVFHDGSPRNVTAEQCTGIVAGLGGSHVGVFVRQSKEEVAAVARRCGLHGLQLHGEYGEDAVSYLKAELPDVFVTRVARVSDDVAELPDTLADYTLLDAYAPDAPGGTGRRIAVGALTRLAAAAPATFRDRVFVAGGLGPENIAEVAALGPFACDLSSGVESGPGAKDHRKMRQLFNNLRGLWCKK